MRKGCVLLVEKAAITCGSEQLFYTTSGFAHIYGWLKTDLPHSCVHYLSRVLATAKNVFLPLFLSGFSAPSTSPITTTTNILISK